MKYSICCRNMSISLKKKKKEKEKKNGFSNSFKWYVPVISFLKFFLMG
jgi:hypothetical protein